MPRDCNAVLSVFLSIVTTTHSNSSIFEIECFVIDPITLAKLSSPLSFFGKFKPLYKIISISCLVGFKLLRDEFVLNSMLEKLAVNSISVKTSVLSLVNFAGLVSGNGLQATIPNTNTRNNRVIDFI